MEHLKYFEMYNSEEDKVDKNEEDLTVFQELFKLNPNSKNNDLYVFAAKDEFVEEDDGRFKKVLGIERMNRVTPDEEGMSAIRFTHMRASYTNIKFYRIWIEKDLREMVDGKGYQDLEPFVLDAITDKLKNYKPDKNDITNLDALKQKAKKTVKNNKEVRNAMDKFNL